MQIGLSSSERSGDDFCVDLKSHPKLNTKYQEVSCRLGVNLS